MDIQDHPFFAKISSAQFEELMKAGEVLHFADRDLIFEESSEPNALYLILSGKVSFRKRLPSGHLLTVSVSEAGGYFGEIGVLTGEPRALQAEAYGDCELISVPKSALVQYLKNMPGPIESLLQSVIRHLHHTTRHYVEDMLHQEKMAVVGSMMNTIIHDFKNPFCLISLSAQLIRQKHTDKETEKLCLNIEKQVDRMVEMAGELAEFSRGEQQLRAMPISLSELMEEFHHLNLPFFDHENVQLSVNVPEVRILGEKAKLFRVFQNLIGNAIEAIGDRDGLVEVSAKTRRDEGKIEISVSDNGNGIPEAIRGRFFEPFVTFGKSEGTGLGTAIVRSIIEAHRGSIRFETETGKGTTFHIELPLAE